MSSADSANTPLFMILHADLIKKVVALAGNTHALRLRCVSHAMQQYTKDLRFQYTLSHAKLGNIGHVMTVEERRTAVVADLVKKASHFSLEYISLLHIDLSNNPEVADAFRPSLRHLSLDSAIPVCAIRALRNCTALASLSWEFGGLRMEATEELMRSLHFEQLQNLTLVRIGTISDAAGDLLAAGLGKAEKLSSLILEDVWGALLGPALQNLQNLHSVKLTRFETHQLASVLAGLRSSARSIWSLEIDIAVVSEPDAQTEAAVMHAISAALAQLTALENLQLNRLLFSTIIFEFTQNLPHLSLMRQLTLHTCGIDNDGAQALLLALPLLTQLEELYLGDNSISYSGMNGFEAALIAHPCLAVLDVSENYLSDTWCERLAARLAEHDIELLH